MATFHRPRQPGASLAHHAMPRITKFQPIPDDFKQGRTPPFHMDLSEVLTPAEVNDIAQSGSMAFHCVGDTGGIKDPEPQRLVARGMEQSLQDSVSPTLRTAAAMAAFCYHIGDVIYYNGEVSEYYGQFYGPYELYPLPIVAIPGNHDGEPINENATSLLGFYENFLARPQGGQPVFTHESQDSGRPAMHQPFFYWTLVTPFATFVGLYSNVPEHGRLDDEQRAWFHAEMANADKTKALIVAVHHPVYSFDTHHSGSPTMAKELEDAINASGRIPNMVLNAHVHNYQRIELDLAGNTIPFFVIGNGGYWNLHRLGAAPGYADPETMARLISATDTHHGFMTFEISDSVINGNFTTVPRPQESWNDPSAYNAHFDVFNYSAKPLFLPEGQTVTLVPPDGAHIPPHLRHDAPAPNRTAASEQRMNAKAAHKARIAHKVRGSSAP